MKTKKMCTFILFKIKEIMLYKKKVFSIVRRYKMASMICIYKTIKPKIICIKNKDILLKKWVENIKKILIYLKLMTIKKNILGLVQFYFIFLEWNFYSASKELLMGIF